MRRWFGRLVALIAVVVAVLAVSVALTAAETESVDSVYGQEPSGKFFKALFAAGTLLVAPASLLAYVSGRLTRPGDHLASKRRASRLAVATGVAILGGVTVETLAWPSIQSAPARVIISLASDESSYSGRCFSRPSSDALWYAYGQELVAGDFLGGYAERAEIEPRSMPLTVGATVDVRVMQLGVSIFGNSGPYAVGRGSGRLLAGAVGTSGELDLEPTSDIRGDHLTWTCGPWDRSVRVPLKAVEPWD